MRKEHHTEIMTAFVVAYETYADALFRYALLRVTDREIALDLVQDTFSKTWDYMKKGNTILNTKAFIYRSLTNAIIDHYRSRKPTASLETMSEEEGFDPPAPEYAVGDMIDGKQAIAMIGRLPEDYRDAVFLRYVEELSIAEIADIIGVSTTLVAVRIHRGIAKLRDMFNHHEKI